MREHRAIPPGLRAPWIYLKRLFEFLRRLLLLLRIDQVIGEQKMTGHMVRVGFKRLLQFVHHGAAVATRICLRQAIMQISVLGKIFQAFGKGLGCELRVVFVERQFADCQIHVAGF